MAHVRGLRRLTLSAIGRTPNVPLPTNGVTGAPELWSDAGVGWITDHLGELSVPDSPGDLRTKLKIQSLVVDTPALIGLQVDTVVRIRDKICKRPLAGF